MNNLVVRILACAVGFCMIAFAQRYTVTELGVVPGTTESSATGLSSTGTATGDNVLFANGKVININTLNATLSFSTGINASNQIVGWDDFETATSTSTDEAFLYTNGAMTIINSPSLFPGGTRALAINNAGQVVSTGYQSPSVFHPFLYSGGRMTDLGGFGGTQTQAFAINNSGVILISGGTPGEFLYANGKITPLGTPKVILRRMDTALVTIMRSPESLLLRISLRAMRRGGSMVSGQIWVQFLERRRTSQWQSTAMERWWHSARSGYQDSSAPSRSNVWVRFCRQRDRDAQFAASGLQYRLRGRH